MTTAIIFWSASITGLVIMIFDLYTPSGWMKKQILRIKTGK